MTKWPVGDADAVPLSELAALPSPEDTADEVLRRAWADEFGDIQLPVDAVIIARRLGADVYTTELGDDDVSALLVGERGEVPRIYINLIDAFVRQRFSCAHEIGHLLRRRAEGAAEFGFIDRRDHLAARGTDPEERWANRFAAALLMPAQILARRAPSEHPDVLARDFRVSGTAMRLRLDALGRPR